MRDTAGIVLSGQDNSILPARVAHHSAGFTHLACSQSLPIHVPFWLFHVTFALCNGYYCLFYTYIQTLLARPQGAFQSQIYITQLKPK